MEQARFQAVITAIDRASAPLRAIAARINAIQNPVRGLQQTFRGLNASMGELSRTSGLNAIGSAASNALGHVRGLSGTLTGLVAPLGALGAVTTIGGLIGMTVQAAEAADAMEDLSEKTGVSVSALAALKYAGLQANLGLEGISSALDKVNKNLALARNGKLPDLAAMFRRHRIPLRDAKGQAIEFEQIMDKVGEVLNRQTSESTRTRMAMTLAGKAGAEFGEVLRGLQAARARLNAFGRGPSPADKKSLADFYAKWLDVQVAVGGVRTAIAVGLAPVLTPLLDKLATSLAQSREDIAKKVTEVVTDLAGRLEKVDWKATWEGIERTGRELGKFVEAIGGARTVIIGFAAVAAGPLLLSMTAAAASFAAVGTALVANPIGGLLLAAGVGAAYGAKKLYDNWEPISDFFTETAATISRVAGRMSRDLADSFGQMGTWLKDTVVGGFESAATAIKDAWQALPQFFSNLWDGITARFTRMWETLRPILENFRLLNREPAEPGPGPRRGTLGGSGGAGGFYAPGAPGGNSFAPLYGPSSAPGPERSGALDLNIRFVNAPADMRVETTAARGQQPRMTLAVGYAMGRGRRPILA